MSPDKRLQAQLDALQANGLRRGLRLPGSGVDFTSNDYLGLAADPLITSRVAERLAKLQGTTRNGSGGSRLLRGHHFLHENLEAQLAERFQAEAALLFPSGYQANLALLSTLPDRGDVVFFDAHCHASLKDGLRLGMAQRQSFAHQDISQVEDKLSRSEARTKYVLVEALYSMDGSFAPFKELVDLCERQGAVLLVDEAHSTGLYGPAGAGSCIDLGLGDRVYARVHTFGKALGAMGACVVGSRTLIDWLVNRARPFIYSTGPAPAQVLLIEEAFRRLDEVPNRRQELAGRIARFQQGMASGAAGPIQAFECPGAQEVVQAATALQAEGFDVRPIRTPTVAEGQERIRICLHANHTNEQIDGLVAAWKRLGVPQGVAS